MTAKRISGSFDRAKAGSCKRIHGPSAFFLHRSFLTMSMLPSSNSFIGLVHYWELQSVYKLAKVGDEDLILILHHLSPQD